MRIALAILFILSGCIVGESSQPPNGASQFSLGQDIGINVAADGAPGAAAVRALGASWVRIELVDGAPSQTAIQAFHDEGLRVLAIVNYSTLGNYPGYYECGPGAGFDDWRAAWTARVEQISTSYGSLVDAWEVWNEEDHPRAPCGKPVEYNPGLPAGVYGAMLRDAYIAIRAGSGAPVVLGGTDSGQVSYVLDAAIDGVIWADAVAVHPYGVVPDPSWCPNPGEDLDCAWGTFLSKIDEYAGATGLPVWMTEFGVRTQDTAHEANYLEGGFQAVAARGAISGPAFYFCYSDSMVPPFGLTYADGTPKPFAYERFQQVANSGGGGVTHASRLHGTVEIGGAGAPGIYVTAWGHGGDLHTTYTDGGGIFAFEGLEPSSLYNVVVNAQFSDGFQPVDGNHAFEVRDNVELVAGPDAWHGENFQLPF